MRLGKRKKGKKKIFMNLVYSFTWLIPIFPLLTSLIGSIGLILFRKATQSFHWRYAVICISGMSAAFLYACILLKNQIGDQNFYEFESIWIGIGNIKFNIGYRIDSLSTLMTFVVTSVSLLVMIYSHGYMKYDEGYVRFFTYLSLFASSMLGLVLSPNLVQIYIFWELIGMCSYLLIGFWSTRASAGDACQKAFLTNRIGDFGFFLGLLGFYWSCNTFNCEELAQKIPESLQNGDQNFLILFSILLILGPFAKSAQFPFHVWLPDAMEGPTPISALIHAATLVAAGVFLVARLLPVFYLIPTICPLIAWIGAFTAFLGASIALTQNDLKKGLAYSTVSQLGYMFMALGIGAYSSALFHLITHAYSKALLFLCAGSVIHGMESVLGYNPSKSQNLFSMGGLKKFMPITQLTFLIGTLSLCGFPPFSCFWSKDAILEQAFHFNPILWFICWITAGLTSFYMFRLYFLTFEGEFQSQGKDPKESDWSFLVPLICLSIPSVGIGFLGSPFLNFFGEFLTQKAEELNLQEFGLTSLSSVFIASLGFLFAYTLHKEGKLQLNYAGLREQNLNLYEFLSQKWYIDDFYQLIFVKRTRQFSFQLLSFDQKLIDGLVNFVSLLTLIIGELFKYFANGKLQTYLVLLVSSICFVYLIN